MALELIAAPVLEVLSSQISSLIGREYQLLRGFNKDLENLSRVMSKIKTVLEDAEAKQIGDKGTRDWLSELKDASYDAEDVLDEWEYEALQQEREFGYANCTKQVSESFSACFNIKQLHFRHKMGKKIKELIKKFDEINTGRDKFQLSPGVQVIANEGLGRNRETSSFLTEPKTYGRGEDKTNIIQMLRDNSNGLNDLSICPVVGMGGLGKTTLAQLVYSDKEVVSQFDTRIWVCISEDFSVKHVSKMMVDHLRGKKCDLEDLNPMQCLLQNLLSGKRYLLVLDDVWDDNQGKWDEIILFLLTCGTKGSSIIVTTRLPTVVDAITSLAASCIINPTFHLKRLSECDSWSLFEQCALKENEDFLEIGKSIVAKCKGVPLAIKTVGSLLRSRKHESFWILVRDSEIWQLDIEGENTILPALRLSYQHLPPVHRQCFAYCSIYPKDFVMSKERLIHGWMANGFIQSSRGIETEDVGDDIFNGLLQRSFFQGHETESTKVKMHDLLHDLACSVTKKECWKLTEMDNTYHVSQKIRHLSCSLDSKSSANSLFPLRKSQPYIRTLMFFVPPGSHLSGIDVFLSCSTSLKRLRVLDLGGVWNLNNIPPWVGHLILLKWLDLENTGISSLPEFVCGLTNLQVLLLGRNGRLKALPSSVGKLKNLRYLGLSETSIEVLPESICSLTNLQTLDLTRCQKLGRLPRDMKKMKSLRKLIIMWWADTELLIKGMPAGIGELTRLETLGAFVVSMASEEAAGIQELGRLNKLKGELIIKDIRRVRDPRDALQANLKNKDKLSRLVLSWGSSSEDDVKNEEEKKRINQVLESLEPHRHLGELEIHEYPGVELPGWVGKLTNLQELDLEYMPNTVHDLHELPPSLNTLWIVTCPKIRLHPELRYPTSIERLSVSALNDPTLRSVEALPYLSNLQIEGFNEPKYLSVLRNLTCLYRLWIRNSSNVKTHLPKLENLQKTLKELGIAACHDLDCITEDGLRNLSSLQTLKFQSCSVLTSLSNSLGNLKSLTRLDLVNCQKLVLSAVDFHHLVALQLVILEKLPQMTSLPDGIQHLMTLRGLYIRECKNLRMLPEWLLQQHLPLSLWYLQIRGCHPELHKRCEVDKGEDWHKISHLQVNNRE